MDASKIADLKVKYQGVDLVSLKSKSAEVVARVTKNEVDLFRTLIAHPSTKGSAMERFVRACVIDPNPDEVAALLVRRPALAERWGEMLLAEAGADEEVELKKL